MRFLKIEYYVLILSVFYSIESLAEFIIYDATLYKNKPDLSAYKVKQLPIIYENTFFGKNKSKHIIPNDFSIRKAVKLIEGSGSNLVVLDIERWELKGRRGLVADSVAKYKKVIEKTRQMGAKSSIGYYGLPPVRDYWRAISNKESDEYRDWQKENDAIKPLANDVDVFYPSLYAFYSDQQGWKKYAIAQISEARRLGKDKPVIVFLWPQYHNSNKILRGQYLSTKFWRLQLDTAKQYADGVIIWGGWKQEWDKDAPWWLSTLKFIKESEI